MLLLNLVRSRCIFYAIYCLHFNMLLLNLHKKEDSELLSLRFTFQYASIKPNTPYGMKGVGESFTFQYASIKPTFTATPFRVFALSLHFNMLLLNLEIPPCHSSLHLCLHFNMLLLNHLNSHTNLINFKKFTFQYASIKPKQLINLRRWRSAFTFQYASIKPCC